MDVYVCMCSQRKVHENHLESSEEKIITYEEQLRKLEAKAEESDRLYREVNVAHLA